MSKRKPLEIGSRFGRLVVIGIHRVPGFGSAIQVKCDCGGLRDVSAANLRSGNTKSCGCLFKESHTTHGMTKTRVYAIWKGMHQRCKNPNNIAYPDYGLRGIVVLPEWDRFETFFEDMGYPPKGGTLERIDNDGPYAKANCRWATHKEQATNKRSNRVIGAFGRVQTIQQWATEYNLPLSTLKNRLDRAKMQIEAALTKSSYSPE